jgi:hypothetical protein
MISLVLLSNLLTVVERSKQLKSSLTSSLISVLVQPPRSHPSFRPSRRCLPSASSPLIGPFAHLFPPFVFLSVFRITLYTLQHRTRPILILPLPPTPSSIPSYRYSSSSSPCVGTARILLIVALCKQTLVRLDALRDHEGMRGGLAASTSLLSFLSFPFSFSFPLFALQKRRRLSTTQRKEETKTDMLHFV